eukprot:jgi/Mesvir1/15204/Mv06438-RA.1
MLPPSDGPPPLEDMSEYLSSLNLLKETRTVVGKAKATPSTTTPAAAESAPTTDGSAGAASQATQGQESTSKISGAAKPLRRGFFDAPAVRSKPAVTAASRKPEGAPKEDAIPFLKATAPSGGSSRKEIPAMFKVEATDADAQRLKSQLLDVMKPTPDLMAQVASDRSVMEGFDDPEVMAAVNEVAKNPAAMARYKDNPKVVKFYTNMCRLMGDRLQSHDSAKKTG